MANDLTLTFKPDSWHSDLIRAVDGHVAQLKNVLRALEDGQFIERARAHRPGVVVQLGLAENSAVEEVAAQTATSTCFKAIASDFISFLDRLIAFQRLMRQGTIHIQRDLVSAEELLEYAKQTLEDLYGIVARDRALTNPKKVAELALTGDDEQIALSYFTLRRCIEHHGSMPDSDITLYFKLIVIFAGDKEITALPYVAKAGQAISMKIDVSSKTFPAGTRITLTEDDIDHIAMTIRFMASEIVRCVSARLLAERGAPNP